MPQGASVVLLHLVNSCSKVGRDAAARQGDWHGSQPDSSGDGSDRAMTLGALVFALLVATGAGFRLGYERHVLSYGRHDPDRLIWLAFAAALFLAVLA